jgi:hypothetical protein
MRHKQNNLTLGTFADGPSFRPVVHLVSEERSSYAEQEAGREDMPNLDRQHALVLFLQTRYVHLRGKFTSAT